MIVESEMEARVPIWTIDRYVEHLLAYSTSAGFQKDGVQILTALQKMRTYPVSNGY